MHITRRQVLVATGAACAVAALPGNASAIEGDMTIGNAASPVQLIEYASLTCPHCAAFHQQVFPGLKTNYIDTGRIGFTLREYPTAPAPIAFAMFQLARCGGIGPTVYFDRVGELFQRQPEFLALTSGADVRDALVRVGAGWGLSETDVIAAMQDEAGVERVMASVESGNALQIPGTPTLVLNGEVLPGAPSRAYESLSGILNEALGT